MRKKGWLVAYMSVFSFSLTALFLTMTEFFLVPFGWFCLSIIFGLDTVILIEEVKG